MKQFNTRNTAAVWIWCSNELSNCMESDSLGLVLLQISSILSLLYTNMSTVINSSICASFGLCEQVPSHIFVIFSYSNTIMAVTRKKARQERSRFTLQFEVSYKESQRLVYFFASSKAYLQAKSNTEWIDGTRIYNSVTVGFSRSF